MDDATDLVPDQAAAILYVLATPQPGYGPPAYLMYDLGGVGCVIAYTDLARLVECCGEHQPWLGIEIAALMADLRDQGLPGPVVNLPSTLRSGGPRAGHRTQRPPLIAPPSILLLPGPPRPRDGWHDQGRR